MAQNNAINLIVNSQNFFPDFVFVSGTTQTMVANKIYVCMNAALTTLTLPIMAALGDKFGVIGYGAGGWKIVQNASQSITDGIVSSTVGVAGFVQSISAKASFNFVNVVVNNEFMQYIPPQGIIDLQ